MSLRDKIEEDYKNSLKSKDKHKISTSRLILSAIKDLDIIKLSIEDLKTTKKELNLLRNVIKTLEELMHGKD